MKKLVLITLLFTGYLVKAQTFNAGTNGAAIATNAPDAFSYLGKPVANYGLGWYSEAVGIPPLMYMSGFAGIKFFTWTEARMIIDGTGKVGIGTLTPTEKLEVNGNAYFQRLRSGNALFRDNSRNSLNSFNTGQDPGLSPGWIAADFGGSDNASDRLVIGTGYGGKAVIGSHNYNLNSWGGDLLINPSGGNVAIGTTAARERLSVNGKIRAQEIKVEASNWPDYVFKKEYQLTPLSEIEKYINTNGHLPDIPSALEVQQEGIALGALNNTLVKKIEELTLHLIEQQKQLTEQAKLIRELKENASVRR
jgi:hypothetical protein